MEGLEEYKSTKLLLQKSILENSFSTTSTRFFQTSTYPNTGELSHQNLSAIRIQFSNFIESEHFSFLHETIHSHNWTQDSLYDPAKLAIHLFCAPKLIFFSNFGHCRKTTVFLMTWCSSMLRRIPRPVWILLEVFFSTPKLLQKSTENGSLFQILWKTQTHPK